MFGRLGRAYCKVDWLGAWVVARVLCGQWTGVLKAIVWKMGCCRDTVWTMGRMLRVFYLDPGDVLWALCGHEGVPFGQTSAPVWCLKGSSSIRFFLASLISNSFCEISNLPTIHCNMLARLGNVCT